MKVNIGEDVLNMVEVGAVKAGEVFLWRAGVGPLEAFLKLPERASGFGHAWSLRLSDNTDYSFNKTTKVVPADAELKVTKRV